MTIDGKQDPDYIGPEHQLPSHAQSAKPSGAKRIWVWIIVLVAFALTLFLILRQQGQSKQAAMGRRAFGGPVTITTATAKTGDMGIYLESIGTVTPVYTATITSQVSGQIVAVRYREGQIVQKGDPLVEIDPRPYQAQLDSARGTLQHDTYLLEQAKMDLERYRSAWAANAIQKQTLDDQEKLVLQDEGTVKTDQGTVQYDEVQLGFCHIVAPISGRVGLRLVDPGNVIQSGSTTELAVITQLQPITVIFTVPEDSLPPVEQQLRKGARLTVDAFDRTGQNKLGSGVLLTADNQIDTTTGTVKLRAQFDNRNQTFYPNAFVNSKLLVSTHHNVTLIPTSTIQHNGDASFVYVVQSAPPSQGQGQNSGAPSGQSAPAGADHAAGGGQPPAGSGGQQHRGPSMVARMRSVKVGATDGLTTEVSGLNGGEIVANSSFDKLQDGATVIVSDKPQPGGTSETSESNAP
jgi:multidrug efflux system membrane fusion protein